MPGRQTRALLRSGDTAPVTGVYAVTHRQHRAPHHVSLMQGDLLPACKRCGQHVRYRLIEPVEPHDGHRLRRNPSLLLVDVESAISYTLRRILETSGFHVVTAGTYREAAKLLRQAMFDVLLTEVDLDRGSDGLRLAVEAKRLDRPPVVVLSASEPSEERLRAALGIANYLVLKPIDLSSSRPLSAPCLPADNFLRYGSEQTTGRASPASNLPKIAETFSECPANPQS